MVEAEADEFEEHVGVVGDAVVVEWGRLVGDDCGVLGLEAGDVVGAEGRLDEDYDSLFCVEEIVEPGYVDEDGAGILRFGGVEHVSVGVCIGI